ncbi:MAG: CD225/dispanin family protein [Thermoguttaceae bacterium]|nr:CD225/dispanin family protein [Thermoguttaceae bacterium]
MFCTNCGAQIQGQFCPLCGTPAGNLAPNANTPVPPPVASPLFWSILCTICCCFPFGIVSIVYAAKVNSLAAVGAYQQAKEAADKAKMWAWLAFGVGMIINLLYLAINVMTVIAAEQEASSTFLI